ncbi:hypothetical protein ASPZODRAFT_148926 [Penicilliopsis zonata CBS 506.65]|uniref:T6SS Phospholipase effector Tle1-like catalytic domain-containing protein n=1 Tax=Penicilliopsis zonata CBS 506.65 TaxID=1073090 RepID=A0A1L9SX03_9EURO|nr:hypothetical protein ASPZODRAFT_148926 [Penicilliopsis zonata CBS 506.65]OJJ51689.1 hypothetical protein ASPZODRAFT_148926 [Penicilliopsis zonata CBS 506.65]
MVTIGPATVPKQFVLCFDGTGNKFSGDESDSNVLKIFRMLDRSKSHQFHYYQPGIGTYVTTTSLSNHGRIHRIRSAYLKAKDSAIGSSFAEHVLGGYKFLMRYYSPGDEIYFIGFSRGAYIARFLAEMLDYIGLLEAGNEELIRFAWKTFAKWQQRRGATDEEREEKKKLFNYMKAFRETFSRPITRIKFMGLFDTVNSVPRFESAWMQRSKFPYTARSSAKVIRHAVGIDERRAKFRQDLISEVKPWVAKKQQTDNLPTIVLNDDKNDATEEPALLRPRPREHGEIESVYRTPRSSQAGSIHHEHREDRYRAPSPQRKLSLAVPMMTASTEDLSLKSGKSGLSLRVESVAVADEEEEDETTQDIQEVWFPGGHADIGGGWKLESGERWPLSHAPLVWMVQEAQRAGLQFDSRKLKQFECCEEYSGEYSPIRDEIFDPFDPVEEHAENCQEPHDTGEHVTFRIPVFGGEKQQSASSFNFFNALHLSSTKGVLHDCLQYGKGLSFTSVLSWRIMEYLPFRRMDLQPDGSWKPIRWPLPCGEVRDIPYDARIHISAIRRMQADANYRPGNLIIGGGGRGVRRAPEKYGIGEWVVLRYEGDTVRETYVRKSVSKRCSEGH